MSQLNRDPRSERGQVIVIFAIGLTAFVFVLALVLDGGRVYVERRRAQNAADAAATAGAAALIHSNISGSIDSVRSAACKAAHDNGFGSGSVDATCGPGGSVVNIHVPGPGGDAPPDLPNVAGSFSGTAGYVQVSVTSGFTSFVQSWLGGSQLNASALAVAANIPGAGIGFSLLVLNPADCGTLSVNGNDASVTVHDGGVMVDSAAAKSASPTCTKKNAVVLSGNNAYLETLGGFQNHVVGDADAPPDADVRPPFISGADFVVDPLAFVHVPDFGQTGWQTGPYVETASHPTILGQPALSYSPADPSLGPYPWKSPFPDPMPPGVVWGGIEVNNNDVLVLQGGTYIMAGGGFVIKGGSVLALSPVTIIMTDDKFCNSVNSGDCVVTAGNGNLTVSGGVGQNTGTNDDMWGSPPAYAGCLLLVPTQPAACQPFDAKADHPVGEEYLNHILIYIDRDVGDCRSGVGNPSPGNTIFTAGGGGSYYFATGSIIYTPCSTVSLFGNEFPFPSHAGSVAAFNVSISGNKTLDLGGPGPISPAPAKTNLVQ
jgi:hypothetical protein